jgi:hypothetical protein
MWETFKEALRKIFTLEAIRNFFSSMFRTGSGTSSKRFVFVGGFFVVSYCLIKLTNALAASIKSGIALDYDVVSVYAILTGMYTTLVLVGYRKPDSKIDTSADMDTLAVAKAKDTQKVAKVKSDGAIPAPVSVSSGPVRVDD